LIRTKLKSYPVAPLILSLIFFRNGIQGRAGTVVLENM
jgi:hypothetical protein